MSEYNPELIEQLMPGDVVEIQDQTQLIPFEDAVAKSIDFRLHETIPGISTRLNLAAWAGRQNITELIRPKKPRPFNGSIVNIRLELMAGAHERLADAKDRGWNIGRPSTLPEGPENELSMQFYTGFKFFAEARSTGRGTIGEIQTELWYYPARIYRKNCRSSLTQKTSGTAGSSVSRTVAKPKMEEKAFAELDDTSRHIGLTILQRHARRATSPTRLER